MQRMRRAAPILGALGLSVALVACAAMTGVTDWKQRDITTKMNRDAAFHAAARALAQIGSVGFSDQGSGTISGECAQAVTASILITTGNGQTAIALKSKMDFKGNEIVIGDARDKCLDDLELGIRKAGG